MFREMVSKFVRTEANWDSTYESCTADFTGVAGDKALISYLMSYIFLQKKSQKNLLD